MAEEVQISNVGGEGVASEVTLARLVAVTEAMAKKAGIDPKDVNKKLKALSTATEDTTKESKKNKDALEENTKEVESSSLAYRSLQTALSGTISGVTSLFAGAAGLTQELINGSTELSSFAKHIPLVGSYLAPLAGLIDDNIRSFRELSNVGATFGDGLNDIRRISAAAGVPLSEFTELVAQNSEKMRFFGGGVAGGATAFAAMSKQLREGPGRRFMNLGYTATDLNEALVEYAEFTGTQMSSQRQQNRLSAQGAANYLETIDQLARVTGKRRDQIREEMQQNQADQRIRAATSKMTAEQAIEFNAALVQAGSASPKLREALIDMADGFANDPFTAQLAANSKTFREEAGNLENMTALQRNNFFAAVAQEADAYAAGLGDSLQGVIAAGGIAGDMASLGAELSRFEAMTPEQQAEIEAAAALEAQRNDGLKLFHDTIRNITTSLMTLLTAPGMDADGNALPSIMERMTTGLNAVGSALEQFVSSPVFKEGIENLSNKITKFISDIERFDLKTALFGGQSVDTNTGQTVDVEGLFGDLGGQISETISSILWSGSGVIVGAIAGLFALSAIKDALLGGIGSLFSAGSEPSSGSRRTAGGQTAGGRAGKGIGQFVGNVSEGALSGAAKGISAFAPPSVILGATNIGLAIVAIGAGVAGATWLLGNALPTFAEGLKSFEEIDGTALINAGAGMAAVAAGMAAFGAGSAVSGLGNLVGSVTNGIAGLFGAEEPLEKIKKFQEYSFDASRIENNASAIVSYSKGMAALGAAEGLSGIGAAVGAIGGAIAGLFGGDDPLTKMKQFEAYTFDSAKIKSNAEAVSAYASAMKDFPNSPAPSIFGSFATGVARLFGAETDPMAPIKRFGELQLNAAGIIANAGAVAAYAEAMKDFPSSPSASLFEAFKNGLISMFGGNTDPFAPMKAFGDMSFNTAGIIANSNSVKQFSLAMSGLASSDISDVEIPRNLAAKLTELSNVPSSGLLTVANGMTAIANVTGLQNNLDILNTGLDTEGVRTYTEAMEDLVEALGKMNEELSRDNNGYGLGTGTNAGDVMGQISTATSGTSQGTQQLNSTMQQVLVILQEMRDLDIDVERNTRNIIGSNLALGGVSNVAN